MIKYNKLMFLLLMVISLSLQADTCNLSNVQSKADALKKDAATLQANATKLQSDAAILKNNANQLKINATTLKTNVATLKTNIMKSQDDFNTLMTLSNNADALDDAADKLKKLTGK